MTPSSAIRQGSGRRQNLARHGFAPPGRGRLPVPREHPHCWPGHGGGRCDGELIIMDAGRPRGTSGGRSLADIQAGAGRDRSLVQRRVGRAPHAAQHWQQASGSKRSIVVNRVRGPNDVRRVGRYLDRAGAGAGYGLREPAPAGG